MGFPAVHLHHKPGHDGSMAAFLTLSSLLLLVSLLVWQLVHRYRPKLLTEAGALILTGVLFNGVLFVLSGAQETIGMATSSSVHDLIFYGLLPPIIFEAGYTLRKRGFLDNLGAILTLALLGTLVTALVTGGFVLAFSRLDVLASPFTFSESLLFGSL